MPEWTEWTERTAPSLRLLTALALAAGLLLCKSPTRAQLTAAVACDLDPAPAATLLLPYFEVDLVHADGRTTLFSIVNAAEAATVASVTLWTDLGVPTLHLNVYLTGYDVQTVNVRDLFVGALPRTASVGQDPGDSISPHGVFSADVNLPECNGLLPPPALSPTALASLVAAHTGAFATQIGGCAGQAFGDGLARGYATIDAVRTCTLRTPADAGYFASGGTGDASDANVLWGDFMLVDPAGNTAVGEPLVRVQAFPGRFHDGDATFYGGHIGHSGVDDREPLATTWATRFLQRGPFSGGTELLVWRDPGRTTQPFACSGGRPTWYPLATLATTFDEQENPDVFNSCGVTTCPPATQPTPFPAMANRVSLAEVALMPHYGVPSPIPYDFGWLYLLFDRLVASEPVQAWTAQLSTASNRFAVGFGATPLVSACSPTNPPPPGW